MARGPVNVPAPKTTDINDQTPTYNQASSLTNLTSGEKLSVSFGKIMKAIADLISHLANKSNPHSVTAAQAGAVPTTRKVNNKALSADITLSKSDVGLGNVPNVATNDQTPTYTKASTLTNLTSGEKLSVSFGKIMKAIADLISHLANKSNPHSVTAAQAGAVPTSRTVNGKALSANISLSASDVGAVAKNEDVVIQKSGAAYDSIFGQGTRNALLRVRNTAGNDNNQRTIALFDSTQRPDLETAVRLYDVVNGTEKIYSLFGEHNLELLADSLASQGLKSATVTATWTASGGYFYQDVTVSGITSADTPVIDILPGSDNAANVLYSEAICKVFRITTSTDSVRIWATEAITTAFPIRIKVV